MKKNANARLIVLSILAGVLVIVSFAMFFRTEESVSLPIKIEEFADFECPACGYYYGILEQVKANYAGQTDNVSFTFKHFPLTSIHKYAYSASLAAEAAREQGKFDEYSDILFTKNYAENQKTDNKEEYLTEAKLIQYAVDLKLDVTKFNSDMKSETIKARVDADMKEAENRNITFTPTFFINGKQFKFQEVSNATSQQEYEKAMVKQFTDYIDKRLEMAKSQKKT